MPVQQAESEKPDLRVGVTDCDRKDCMYDLAHSVLLVLSGRDEAGSAKVFGAGLQCCPTDLWRMIFASGAWCQNGCHGTEGRVGCNDLMKVVQEERLLAKVEVCQCIESNDLALLQILFGRALAEIVNGHSESLVKL